MSFINGTAGAPSIAFTNDLDTGIYLRSAGDFAATVGGSAVMSWNTKSVSTTMPFWATSGTVGKPSIAFSSDQNTGFYKAGNGIIGVSLDGVLGITLSAKGITLPVSNTAGRPSTPTSGTIRVNSETNGLDVYIGSAWVSITGTELAPAVAADIWEGTSTTKIITAKAVADSLVFQTITATPNNALFTNGKITIAANTTFGAFTNPKEGRSGVIAITIGGSGSYTGTFNAFYDFGTAGAPTLSTTVGKVDHVHYTVLSGGTKASCIFVKSA